jgi:tRNA A37 threonylcarbamoyladenosine biosynthesis protein TsaE
LRAGIIDERQQHGVTLIEWPEHLEGIGAEGTGVLTMHLAAAAEDGARSAVISGARPEFRAVLDASFGTSEGDRG